MGRAVGRFAIFWLSRTAVHDLDRLIPKGIAVITALRSSAARCSDCLGKSFCIVSVFYVKLQLVELLLFGDV